MTDIERQRLSRLRLLSAGWQFNERKSFGVYFVSVAKFTYRHEAKSHDYDDAEAKAIRFATHAQSLIDKASGETQLEKALDASTKLGAVVKLAAVGDVDSDGRSE